MIVLREFKDRLQMLRDEAEALLKASERREAVDKLRVRFLGRKSELSLLLRSLQSMPREVRVEAGTFANRIRREVEAMFQNRPRREDTLGPVNVTLPGRRPRLGHEHLVSRAIREISDIFTRLGFGRVRHPEVESDWYAFAALNMPPDHPARDEWETFFVDGAGADGSEERFVLTPHATSGTARALAARRLPLRVINIQKCYRRESDVAHVPMFHQFDGVWADRGVTFQHLKGVLEYFVKAYFGADREARLRPHHFRFTEPSFEVDVSCGICRGRGCRLCKEGWLELGGAGMLHPNVFRAARLDPKKVAGLAFGWGVERVLLMRAGLDIPDMRILYENDLRFLEQF